MITTAVILCGGGGQRMGGIDKPLHALLGRPLLDRVLECLRPQADAAVLVANRQLQAYAVYGIPVIDDGVYQGRGPLAGIAAGLTAAAGDWVLCAPGDAPLLPPDLLQRLRRALRRDAADLAVVHDGRGRQPLCCLLPRRLLADLRNFLDEGGDAPRLWLDRFQVAEADCSDWPRWAWSLNTPEEWRAAEGCISQGKDPP
jgi:molybdopterin-guanine dinucleotide biosynthesis protein A